VKIHPSQATLGLTYWEIVPLRQLREKDAAALMEVAQHADKVKADFASLPKPPRPWDRQAEPGRSKFF
jgi:hypothetical protein